MSRASGSNSIVYGEGERVTKVIAVTSCASDLKLIVRLESSRSRRKKILKSRSHLCSTALLRIGVSSILPQICGEHLPRQSFPTTQLHQASDRNLYFLPPQISARYFPSLSSEIQKQVLETLHGRNTDLSPTAPRYQHRNMASKVASQDGFGPVLAALATMQSNGSTQEKTQAHEFLEQFQKSVCQYEEQSSN